MPTKKKSAKGGGRVPRKPAPKWKRDGFKSYRQYLNARYKSLGFNSYSEYTEKRRKGEVASTKGLARAKPGSAKPVFEVTQKQLRNIVGLERVGFESQCPIRYTIHDSAGDAIAAWLRDFAAQIKHDYAGQIYSAAWRIIGQAAQQLDDDTGQPIWNAQDWEEWSSHMDYDKAIRQLISTARAYGNHEFLEYGRQIGRTGSRVYALLITKVRISIVLVKQDDT